MLTPSELSLDFPRWLSHMDLGPEEACPSLGIGRATLNRLIARRRTEGVRVYPVHPSPTMRLLMTALQERKTLAKAP